MKNYLKLFIENISNVIFNLLIMVYIWVVMFGVVAVLVTVSWIFIHSDIITPDIPTKIKYCTPAAFQIIIKVAAVSASIICFIIMIQNIIFLKKTLKYKGV